jgi:hypothetical protein
VKKARRLKPRRNRAVELYLIAAEERKRFVAEARSALARSTTGLLDAVTR